MGDSVKYLNTDCFYGVMDCDNFFVSCERVFNPALEGKSVVVLSNNDGCAVSRSREAKELGIEMGTPAFKIKEDFIAHGKEVQMCSSNYTLYADMSRRVMSVLQTIVSETEPYSIDESFIKFRGMSRAQIVKKGREIAYKVRKYTGIPVSVGVAPTMTLAKVASKYAKKYKGYKGFCIIDTEEKRVKALKLLDVGEVWGIGRRYTKRLKAEGICTAFDFTMLSPAKVQRRMGSGGVRTYDELQGESVIDLGEEAPRKTITTSRSFGELVTTKEQLSVAVANFASSCAEKLRAQKSVARFATVHITTNIFRGDLPQYENSALVEFPEETNSTVEIVKECVAALDSIFREGFKYKKAGVLLSGIIPSTQVQQNLFLPPCDYEKMQSVNRLLDDVNRRYGRNKLHLAIQGSSAVYNRSTHQERSEQWEMRRDLLSANYTTDLSDIITIKAE